MSEGRRGFFGRFFGGRGADVPAAPPELIQPIEQEAELDVQETEDQLKPAHVDGGMSRRNFLRGAGALLGAAAVEKTISPAHAHERGIEVTPRDTQPTKNNIHNESENEPSIEEQEKSEVDAFLTELEDFKKETNIRLSPRELRSTADLDALHCAFIERFGSRVQTMLDRIVKFGMTDKIPSVYELLRQTDALGLYYSFVSNTGDKYRIHPQVDGRWQEEKFQGRAQDYLPSGAEIENYEIDPRLLQIVKRDIAGNYEYADVELVRDTLREFPGWTDNEKMLAFRAILDDAPIRELFSQSDCSLAEVYSIIKAAIKVEGPQAYPTVYEQRINELLRSREEFKTKEIIGPSTEHFIHFTSTDKTVFDPEIAEYLGSLVTIWDTTGKHVDERIDNDEQAKKRKRKKNGEDPIITALQKQIGDSTGKTVIYFSTHGEPNSLELHHKGEDSGLTAVDLANCLALRINNTMDARTLGDVTIMLNSCSSHNFAENLVKELRSSYTGDMQYVERIAMPTIISSAQEGSLAYSSGIINDTMNKYLAAIVDEGKVTGEFLLRRLQPDAYAAGDVTVFTQDTQQKWMEIGQQEKEQKSLAA